MTLNEQTTYKLKSLLSVMRSQVTSRPCFTHQRHGLTGHSYFFILFRLLDCIDHCAWHYHLCWLTHVLHYLTSQTRAKTTNVSTQSMFNICILVTASINNCWIKQKCLHFSFSSSWMAVSGIVCVCVCVCVCVYWWLQKCIFMYEM